MQSIAYIDAPRQDGALLLAQSARRLSLSKLSVVTVSLALWATMIGGLLVALR